MMMNILSNIIQEEQEPISFITSTTHEEWKMKRKSTTSLTKKSTTSIIHLFIPIPIFKTIIIITMIIMILISSVTTTTTTTTSSTHSSSSSSSSYPQTKCLKNIRASPPHFFQIKNEIYNITIETSERIGHQLVTHAFSIFLKEILGYESVYIIKYPDYFNASATLNRISSVDKYGHHPERWPETIINLAVWMSPEIELDDWTMKLPGHIENCGHLGFPGRFGWFIPRLRIVDENPLVDYWRTFLNHNGLTSRFNLFPNDFQNATNLSIKSIHGHGHGHGGDKIEYYCEESFCKNGMYVPEICSNVDCAVLLASYPESSKYIPEQIELLKLYVRVIWLGPNLNTFVKYLVEKYKEINSSHGILFFSWKPTVLTTDFSSNDLLSVNFQPCNNNDFFCNYESRKLGKIVSSKLKEGAPFAHEAVQRISFTEEEYIHFLQLYKDMTKENNKNNIGNHGGVDLMESIACKWMKENEGIWKTWKSTSYEEKASLYIGGIFPITGSYTAGGVVTAAVMATQAVNANTTILRDYELKLIAYDGQCRPDMVMRCFIDYIRQPTFSSMAGILGPACSDTVEPLAGVATHFKTVVISYSAEGSSFSDREKYPYFFRTIGENKQYQHVYLKLFQEIGWKRIASLTEEGQKYAEYISHLHDLLQENEIAFIANRKFPRERHALNMSQYLQDLKAKKAKIIIGDFYDHSARAVMCEAYKQKMTAKEGYVWFLPVWFNPQWYDTDYLNSVAVANGKINNNNNNGLNENGNGKDYVPCNTSEMIQAINGHLSLQYAYFAPDNHIIQENITVKEWKKKYTNKLVPHNFSISEYAGYAYDAVWTYAFALDKLLRENPSYVSNLHDDKTTSAFVQIINNTDFHGLSGHIKFVDGPSRLSIIHVVQWLDKKTHIVGSFHPTTPNNSSEIIGGKLDLNISAIKWLNQDGTIPQDGSEPPATCVLETLATALDVTCEVAIVIANVIGFSILGTILVICFAVIKRRYDRRVAETREYFKAYGIDILSAATSISALDKWEIPRDRVVINRKLGEGAFGTVYGGECFFDDKGWVAVAVKTKTFKSTSTCEEKLEFLGEAEVMKRFDHKNIIKLLGVCSKSEPLYTIMEFMLYDNLKTYLLARRHLVNEENCEESNEISSKRLTSMTLDVARALSYLTELKYVHRDLACRNCLVNASRVVKLGDFGMTRPMYENDYYRYHRKGLLPVRWMAPESLEHGIYTPMSDVWSFGVVLYEIITFGSFPFQGLSNNQVLEHVKTGQTLPIPNGIKRELEILFRSCWTFEPQGRPQSSEIVEFLANNPRIISPCLDIPLASVQLEGSTQFEIPTPTNTLHQRKLNNGISTGGGGGIGIKFSTKPKQTLLRQSSELNQNSHRSPETIPLTQQSIECIRRDENVI